MMTGLVRRRRLTIGICLATASWVGCGPAAPPPVSNSETKATVKGVVTIDGKPINSGQITFDPANAARPTAPSATAKIESGGKYSLETLVGSNAVTVTSPQLQRGGGGQYDVQAGSNDYNLDLKIR